MSSPSQQQPEKVRLVAERICRYLESRPNALDSLDGILRWWLLKQKLEESTELVQAAMDYLVSSGVVDQIDSSGRTFYTPAAKREPDESEDPLTRNS